MKKIIVVFLFAFFASGCALIPYMNIDENVYKEKVKKNLILPVYSSDQLIPDETAQWGAEFAYPDNYKKFILEKVDSSNEYILNELQNIFPNGKYKIECISYTEKAFPPISKKAEPKVFNTTEWNSNFEYSISIDDIKSLAEKYNADAVLFQYIQSIKTTIKVKVAGRMSWIYPVDSLYYKSFIYYKTGKIIFTMGDCGKICYLQNFSRKQENFETKHSLSITDRDIISTALSNTAWSKRFRERFGFLQSIHYG